MKAEFILLIVLVLIMIFVPMIRHKYKDKLSEPRTQKIFGYLLIIFPCLAFVLNLAADLLEGKVNTLNFIISIIGTVCFLVLGIMLIRKSKKKEK